MDWSPDLRIADIYISNQQVLLKVANLAKPTALVTKLKLGTGGRSGSVAPQGVETYHLNLLIPGGQLDEHGNIDAELVKYREKYSPVSESHSPWETSMNISLVYDCGGKKKIETEWRDYTVNFIGYRVTGVRKTAD